jgi:hypothetical protein
LSETPSEKAINRLAYQFKNSTTYKLYLEAFLAEQDELALVETQLRELRYLDTAFGAQLDGIGEIVGISRPTGYTDEQYLFVIKVKILSNSTNMNIENFIELIAFVFGPGIRYRLAANLSPIFYIEFPISAEAEFAFNLLPTPLGIDIKYVYAPDPDTTFSFAEDPTGLGYGVSTDPTIGGNYAKLL